MNCHEFHPFLRALMIFGQVVIIFAFLSFNHLERISFALLCCSRASFRGYLGHRAGRRFDLGVLPSIAAGRVFVQYEYNRHYHQRNDYATYRDMLAEKQAVNNAEYRQKRDNPQKDALSSHANLILSRDQVQH